MRKRSLVAAALLLLAACGTAGLGGLGTILGSPSSAQPSRIQGTVNYVDANAGVINLDVSYVNNLRETRSGQTIYYDANTRVVYQGRDYRVTDLERGDQVSITGHNDNGRWVADTITVTRNVRG